MFRLWKACQLLLPLALTSLLGIGPVRADFSSIDIPDAVYTSRTILWSPSDGRLTVRGYKANPLEWLTVGGGTAEGWGTPPFAESATAVILRCNGPSSGSDIVLTFSSPLRTVGLEARAGFPASGEDDDQSITVIFYNGAPFSGRIVGIIDRTVSVTDGAFLFAGTTTTEVITSALIHFRESGCIGQLRYQFAEPVPIPTNAQLYVASVNGVPTSGRPDQVTLSVGDSITLNYLVKFRTGGLIDVTHMPNTGFFVTSPRYPPGYYGHFYPYDWGEHKNTWSPGEGDRDKVITLYARHHSPYAGQSITDTIIVHIRR